MSTKQEMLSVRQRKIPGRLTIQALETVTSAQFVTLRPSQLSCCWGQRPSVGIRVQVELVGPKGPFGTKLPCADLNQKALGARSCFRNP